MPRQLLRRLPHQPRQRHNCQRGGQEDPERVHVRGVMERDADGDEEQERVQAAKKAEQGPHGRIVPHYGVWTAPISGPFPARTIDGSGQADCNGHGCLAGFFIRSKMYHACSIISALWKARLPGKQHNTEPKS